MSVNETTASSNRYLNRPTIDEVVFVMGPARSGSTLLGTLIGQTRGVFFAGELCDWPGRSGVSTIPRSETFWKQVRITVGALPPLADRMKQVMEHPRGLLMPVQRLSLRHAYRRTSLAVLDAVAEHSRSTTIIDSSHYPRRAAALRRLLGATRVRLVFMVRRPSAVARSFRQTEDKSELTIQLYLFAVGVLAWFVYLTHPQDRRALISYETLVVNPLAIGGRALGRPLDDVDPEHLQIPQIFIGNRWVKENQQVAIRPLAPHRVTLRDRITDVIQWPLRLACFLAGRR